MIRQTTRRRNIRRTIAAHREGRPESAPCGSLKWAKWVDGERRAARRGKKLAADLDRGNRPDTAALARQYRITRPGRRPNPPLPAQQARFLHTPGPRTSLRPLRRAYA